MKNISFLEYLQLFKQILGKTLLGDYKVMTLGVIYMISVAVSTYFVNMTTKTSTQLIKNLENHTEFNSILMLFLLSSIYSVLLKYIPMFLFDYYLQDICRNQFIIYAREYLRENYIDFHKKTPGDMRYAIFLKSIAAPLTANLTISEIPMLFGTTYFFLVDAAHNIDRYSLLFLVLIPCIYLPLRFYFVHKKMDFQTNYFSQQQKMSSKLYDKLLNYEVIKTYNLEESEATSFYEKLGDQKRAYVELGKVDAIMRCTLDFVLLIPYVLALGYGSFTKSNSDESTFKLTLQYTILQSTLRRIGREYDNLMWFLNQIKFTEAKGPTPEDGKDELTSFENSIEFKDVRLLHDTKIILENLNFAIEKGEKVAIVGPNGTGKSTLVKSLLGFVKMEGEILFDDKSTNDLSWKSIIKQISYIPQDDFTSDDTIKANLLLGDKNASDDLIIEKSKLFGAHEAFMSLESGYETRAGPRGNKLSGGQKQKLSLIRAVLKDAPLFILDEATASMDKNYEKVLISHIFNHLEDKTLIMIVHGRDYLHKFDKILFMNSGTLEDSGNFESLYSRSNNFREFIGEE